MGQKLARAGFGQPHQVFDLQIVIQLGAFLGGQRGRLLAFEQIPNALPCRLGRLEFNQFPRPKRGNEFNNFFVRFHSANVTPAALTGKDYGESASVFSLHF
jgi:hypothetical protein